MSVYARTPYYCELGLILMKTWMESSPEFRSILLSYESRLGREFARKASKKCESDLK